MINATFCTCLAYNEKGFFDGTMHGEYGYQVTYYIYEDKDWFAKYFEQDLSLLSNGELIFKVNNKGEVEGKVLLLFDESILDEDGCIMELCNGYVVSDTEYPELLEYASFLAKDFNNRMKTNNIMKFVDTFDTYIIAYCPDTDSFFVTNERYFFWESKEKFVNEEAGITYFKNNINKFKEIREDILQKTGGWNVNRKFVLENTKELF
jgi:hypothetical protein